MRQGLTYRPNKRRKARKHGFRARQKSRLGRSLLARRRLKRRRRLTV